MKRIGSCVLAGLIAIGLEPDGSIATLARAPVSLILLVILVMVIVSESVAAKIRHAII